MHLYPHLFIPPNTPAAYVADPSSVDLGQPEGVWLNLDLPLDVLRRLVGETGLCEHNLAVIDQIQAGSVMLDEDTSLSMLCVIAHRSV